MLGTPSTTTGTSNFENHEDEDQTSKGQSNEADEEAFKHVQKYPRSPSGRLFTPQAQQFQFVQRGVDGHSGKSPTWPESRPTNSLTRWRLAGASRPTVHAPQIVGGHQHASSAQHALSSMRQRWRGTSRPRTPWARPTPTTGRIGAWRAPPSLVGPARRSIRTTFGSTKAPTEGMPLPPRPRGRTTPSTSSTVNPTC